MLATLLLGVLWLVDPRVGRLWWNTAKLSAGASLLAVLLGTAAALIIVKTDAPGRRIAAIILAAMLLIPLFLIAGAWEAGFGIQGWHTLTTNPHLARPPWLAGWRAAIWIHALAGVPWVALIVAGGLRAVETELEEDASLCVSPPRVLWHITLPRAAPAIAIAALWVAIIASVEISVTDFFQVRTFAEEVYTQAALGAIDFTGDSANPVSAVGWWLGLLLSAFLAVTALLAARWLLSDMAGVSLRNTWIWRLGKLRWAMSAALCLLMLLVAGVPFANLLYKAGGQTVQTESGRARSWSLAKAVAKVSDAPREFGGDLWLSAKWAAAAATGALCIGLPLAWSIRCARRTPIARLLVLAFCFTIPGPVLGIAVIRFLNQPPASPIAFLAPLYDSYFATWLVQTIRALPLVTLALWAALVSIPPAMLDAAALDGAGWWRRLLQIALPQRWPAVAAAWLVGFAIAFGELAATVLVLPPDRSTAITVRVFQLLHYGADDRVAAISLLVAVIVAGITLAGAALVWLRAK